jgi:hypothetical protein
MAEKKKGPAENDSAELKPVVSIPTIDYFEKTYGRSMEGNDQKAVKVFAEYETKEKIRRLQNELIWIKEGRVPDTTLKAIIGGKRKARYQGYNQWASRMLLWLAAKR